MHLEILPLTMLSSNLLQIEVNPFTKPFRDLLQAISATLPIIEFYGK